MITDHLKASVEDPDSHSIRSPGSGFGMRIPIQLLKKLSPKAEIYSDRQNFVGTFLS